MTAPRHSRYSSSVVTKVPKDPLDRLYAAFNYPDSAADPVQIVRRYPALEDREIVAFVAAGARVRACGVGPGVSRSDLPGARTGACPVRAPLRSGQGWRAAPAARAPLDARRGLHRACCGRSACSSNTVARSRASLPPRWIPPPKMSVWRSTSFRNAHGASICVPAYRRVPARPGVFYFFAQPSSGSACKRLNLFLRWMVRSDGVDPGGWTSVQARQLVVPLDTHTIRVGQCLRLTRRTSPGWKMAVDITRALRVLDPDDPVRYDFALCHLSMMGGCGFGTARGQTACPLAGVCHPRASRASRRRR